MWERSHTAPVPANGQRSTASTNNSYCAPATNSGEPQRRAFREQSTARTAIHAMLRAAADKFIRPNSMHDRTLVLAGPTGAVNATGEELAGRRRDHHTTIGTAWPGAVGVTS